MAMENRVILDLETRSYIDLGDVGVWNYSKHLSTQILCIGWYYNGDFYQWVKGDPAPIVLFGLINGGAVIEAHNMSFEYCLWENVFRDLFDNVPHIDINQTSCTMARAHSHGLPGKLEVLGETLNLTVKKDTVGKKAMLKFSKPGKDGEFIAPEDEPGLFKVLLDYNKTDVLSELELSKAIPELTPNQRKIWLMDHKINERGLQFDMGLVNDCVMVATQLASNSKGSITELTGGTIDSINKVKKITDYINGLGYSIKSLSETNVKNAINDPGCPENIRAILATRLSGGKASVKKFHKIREMVDDVGISRFYLTYHGAVTGRWTSKGIQLQNMTRGILKDTDDIDKCINIVKARNTEAFKTEYKDPTSTLASLTRSTIIPREGKKLFVADYSAIEFKILLWLSGVKWALNAINDGKDLYTDMAAEIYQLPIKAVDKNLHRPIGKTACLGLGYQMGGVLFQATVFKNTGIKLDLDFCMEIVKIFRYVKYPEVRKLWELAQNSAINAVLKSDNSRDQLYRQCKVIFYKHKDFLYCQLPSGRRIAYYKPEIRQGKYGLTLSYIKNNFRKDTYGGDLVEGICQGTAVDIVAGGMLACEENGFDVLLQVHDELISEKVAMPGDIELYKTLLESRPTWADKLPINIVEVYIADRYRK